ncbi:acyl dehydratase [Aliiruegeria haliotis]|uniref:Acyl dehydratase n=1 Tax=Aliiruegeria haliotis TaxID=1280846 RepID=A0A2T0RFN4_9RHOB|nr:MaoC/PaaZ C-terminal domain-containing protein [Aliiruegeria haliotis]PRY19920.1 acyl dehydratase [Aliiruegeria haliotis]
MDSAPFAIGETHRFRKTVSESDVYQFAGITGDLSPNHVDEDMMSNTPFGGRIAHGALTIGYMSTCSSKACEGRIGGDYGTPVSLGYDRIRFVAPVMLGDTIEVTYVLAAYDPDKRRSTSDVTVTNQRGKTVAVATHIMTWVPD